jgi:hypothetical protein
MRDDPRKDAMFNGTIREMYDRFSAPFSSSRSRSISRAE